ncbi:MAG TPA: DoxX family protein [Holophagaceae bacterium]|nr:DoxX family protein [Holophagaceae bacterium]
MFNRLLKTTDDSAILIVRLVLGVVFFAHGAQKMLGWFGGYGFHGTMGFFTNAMHIPAAFAFLAIAAEFFGALGLITGLLGRVAAFGIFCTMAVAVYMVHAHVGFFMNWNGVTPPAEGYEYHLLAMAMALAVMIKGSGAFSLDRMIAKD